METSFKNYQRAIEKLTTDYKVLKTKKAKDAYVEKLKKRYRHPRTHEINKLAIHQFLKEIGVWKRNTYKTKNVTKVRSVKATAKTAKESSNKPVIVANKTVSSIKSSKTLDTLKEALKTASKEEKAIIFSAIAKIKALNVVKTEEPKQEPKPKKQTTSVGYKVVSTGKVGQFRVQAVKENKTAKPAKKATPAKPKTKATHIPPAVDNPLRECKY